MICIVKRYLFATIVCCRKQKNILHEEVLRRKTDAFLYFSFTLRWQNKVCPNRKYMYFRELVSIPNVYVPSIKHDGESCFSRTNWPRDSFFLSDRLSDIARLLSKFWFFQFSTGCTDELYQKFLIIKLSDEKTFGFGPFIWKRNFRIRQQLFSPFSNFYKQHIIADAGTVHAITVNSVLTEHFPVPDTACLINHITNIADKLFCWGHIVFVGAGCI